MVSHPGGAVALIGLDDLSPLIEIAPSRPLALDVLSMACAWIQGQDTAAMDKEKIMGKIDGIIQRLVTSFKGTDAVTLLAFLSTTLRRLDPEVQSPLPFSPSTLY